MKPVVDAFGKVTVSLAGVCALACRHCYTMTNQFKNANSTGVDDVISDLEGVESPFNTICVSGDTDCFLDEEAGFELIRRLAERFQTSDVMFTTRIVPSNETVRKIVELGREMSAKRRLLLPGISLVSMQVPNFSERSSRIPSAQARIELLRTFAENGLPSMLALRPTFPFSLVPQSEVAEMVERVAERATVVLGEILILDNAGQLATRLSLSVASEQDRLSPMTFLDQPTLWKKRTLSSETRFAAQIAKSHGISYFLRSGSALEFIKANWNWSRGVMRQCSAIDDIDFAPDP